MDTAYFTVSDGTKLAYQLEGTGEPTLILLHGWCSNLRHWEPQARYFSRRLRVLRVDRRGHGQSEAPPGDYTPQQHAADVAAITSALGIRRAVAVGHAGGCPPTLALAQGFPELVSAVVLIEGGLYPSLRDMLSRGDARGQQLETMSHALAGHNYARELSARYEGFFHPQTERAVVQGAIEDALRTPQSVAVAEMRDCVGAGTVDLAREVRHPVLWIAAQWTPRSDPKVIEETFPQVHYGRVVGAGHFPQLEVPDQVNAMLDRFLALTSGRNV